MKNAEIVNAAVLKNSLKDFFSVESRLHFTYMMKKKILSSSLVNVRHLGLLFSVSGECKDALILKRLEKRAETLCEPLVIQDASFFCYKTFLNCVFRNKCIADLVFKCFVVK